MQFDEYQKESVKTDQNPIAANREAEAIREPCKAEVIPLLGLVGEVGGLLAEYKKVLRDGATHERFKEELTEQLGDILWYVANTADKFGLSLEAIAEENLRKTRDRWLRREAPSSLYDDSYPEDQRLHRQFEYRFEHRNVEGEQKLALVDQMSGVETGDPLTDNASEDDGYRYHDVLHLTFAAYFGWSPIWRKLLRRQGMIRNREGGDVSEVQDGGRAQVIEEAIVAAAYVYASTHNFLDGVGAIDWRLLRHIMEMTKHLEVNDRTAREWNDVLMRGFQLWSQLREHRGGIVRGDLRLRKIKFSPTVKT